MDAVLKKHAVLSASASSRWLHCPPSLRAAEHVVSMPSKYADEGTLAHELCAHTLEKKWGMKCDPLPRAETEYTEEMKEAAVCYAAFVSEQAGSEDECDILIETRIDYSKAIGVPDSFGTADCILLGHDGIARIIDFKYGYKRVEVEKNTQLMLYAAGVMEEFGKRYGIKEFRLSIFQPRISNVHTWTISAGKLMSVCEKAFRPAAQLAVKGEGEFRAGEWCRFCPVRAICRKNAERLMVDPRMTPPALLTDAEIVQLLNVADDLTAWLGDVKEFALQAAKAGHAWHGFKLGHAKGKTVFVSETAVAEALKNAGIEPYAVQPPKLRGISELKKELGKKKFDALLGSLTVYREGSERLIKEENEQ